MDTRPASKLKHNHKVISIETPNVERDDNGQVKRDNQGNPIFTLAVPRNMSDGLTAR